MSNFLFVQTIKIGIIDPRNSEYPFAALYMDLISNPIQLH